MGQTLVDDLADVRAIGEQVPQRASAEVHPTYSLAIRPDPTLGSDSLLHQPRLQAVEGPELEKAAKDEPDRLGLVRVHRERASAVGWGVIPERRRTAHPHTLGLRAGDLVANALARDLP